jgi:hypothetical protein
MPPRPVTVRQKSAETHHVNSREPRRLLRGAFPDFLLAKAKKATFDMPLAVAFVALALAFLLCPA